MNTKSIAAALVAAAGFVALPSFAGGNISGEVGYIPPVTTTVSGLSREAVRAELLQAQREHTLVATGEAADLGAAVVAKGSERSRDAVRAEAVYAVHNGQLVGGEV